MKHLALPTPATSPSPLQLAPVGLQTCCPGTSVAYADGSTECELPGCHLAHDLHEWVASAADLVDTRPYAA